MSDHIVSLIIRFCFNILVDWLLAQMLGSVSIIQALIGVKT